MFLSYRDGLSFYRQNHKYRMRRGLAEGLTEESRGWGWGGVTGEENSFWLCHRHPGWPEGMGDTTPL